VLLAGLGLMVAASAGLHFAETLPQLIAARFLQALGGATGHGVSAPSSATLQPRAHQRDDQPGDRRHDDRADAESADRRPAGDRVRLALDLLRHHGRIPCDRRRHRLGAAGNAPRRAEGSGGFRGDVGSLFTSRAFIGYVLCQVLASQIIFAFAGGGPYIVVTQMAAPAPNTAPGLRQRALPI